VVGGKSFGSGLNPTTTNPEFVVLVEFKYLMRRYLKRYKLKACAGPESHGNAVLNPGLIDILFERKKGLVELAMEATSSNLLNTVGLDRLFETTSTQAAAGAATFFCTGFAFCGFLALALTDALGTVLTFPLGDMFSLA
jgi:hypothetical protein